MCRKLRDISKKEMIKIASTYANEKNATKKTIANDHNISVDMVSNVFIACFRQKLVDVATAINIAKKAIKNTSLYSGQEKTKKYYREMIFDYYGVDLELYLPPPRENGRKILDEYERKKAIELLSWLESISSSYDDFSISDDEGPTIDEIASKIYFLRSLLT